MDAGHHDLVLAITSHLPHLIAYNIVGTAAQLENDTRSAVIKYSARVSRFHPYRRFRPDYVARYFSAKQRGRAGNAGAFQRRPTALQRAIRHGDGEYLENTFTTTRSIRRSIIEAGQDVDLPNFGATSATPAK